MNNKSLKIFLPLVVTFCGVFIIIISIFFFNKEDDNIVDNDTPEISEDLNPDISDSSKGVGGSGNVESGMSSFYSDLFEDNDFLFEWFENNN